MVKSGAVSVNNYAGTWDYNKFAYNSYNLTGNGEPWCVKPGSIYTNPNAKFDYFTATCGDPYTYYAYWYRRFPNQTKYLNCYNLPARDPLLRNQYGYSYPVYKGKQQCNVSNTNPHWNATDGGFHYFDY